MNSVPLELTGLGFWLALALVVISVVWARVKKQQMKHELTLKLLEKDQGVDTELLAKLMAPGSSRIQKSLVEQRRDDGFMGGLMFIVPGFIIVYVALVRQSGPSWPLLGFGAFVFLFGIWIWYGTMKEYNSRKEVEKDLTRN